MSSNDPEARQLLYVNLMSEIKGRLDVIKYILSRDAAISASAKYEFGYLQLRMVCEVISLACLTAHGDVIAAKKPRLRGSWRAGEIIKGLEQLHPGFYPKPVREILSDDGTELIGIQPIAKNKSLSKKDLLTLYRRCGDILHRGRLNDISPRTAVKADLIKIADWHNKILHLLNRHYIEMVDSNAVYVMMQEKGTKRIQLLELTRLPDGTAMVH